MKILTINGGGALGLIPLIVLRELEKETGKQIHELFQFTAGVSTGSIIASAMASGMTANDMVKRYKELIPKLFGNPQPFWKIWKAKYSGDYLEKKCKELFDFDMNTVKIPLMINSVNIAKPQIAPQFWKSWKDDIKLYDVIVSSCSAPTYFKPHVIGDKVYIDGGISTNNISTCALVEAIRMGQKLEDITIVDLTCYSSGGFKDAQKMQGIIHWATKIASAFLSTSHPLTNYQCTQLIGNRYVSLSPNFNADLDCLDLEKMEEEGMALWEKNKELLLNIVK